MVTGKKKEMMKSMLAATFLLAVLGVDAGSNFADSLAECSAVQELNICLREVLIGEMMMTVIAMVIILIMVVVTMVILVVGGGDGV